MLYANLLMFCSYNIASQCCSLQSLSFTGFLKGYFIACHYHSLWLYGLCSPLACSPDAAAAALSPPHLPLPLFCRGDRPLQHKFYIIPSASCPSGVPQISPLMGAAGARRWESVISAPECLRDLNWMLFSKYRWLFHRVNMKFQAKLHYALGVFWYLSSFFYYANAYLKEIAMFHSNDIIKLIIIY